MNEQIGQPYYQAAADTDIIITAKRAILHRIIIGKDVSSAVIEVSDSKDDGDGDVKIYLADSNLGTKFGVVEVGLMFEKGIVVDQTLQTNVTYVWSNAGQD